MKRMLTAALLLCLLIVPSFATAVEWTLYDDFNLFHKDNACGFDSSKWTGINYDPEGKEFDSDLVTVNDGALSITNKPNDDPEIHIGYTTVHGLEVIDSSSLTAMRVEFAPQMTDEYTVTSLALIFEGVSLYIENSGWGNITVAVSFAGFIHHKVLVTGMPLQAVHALSIDCSDGRNAMFVAEVEGNVYELIEPLPVT